MTGGDPANPPALPLPFRAGALARWTVPFLPRANRALFGAQAGAGPVGHGEQGGGHQQPGEGSH